MEVVEEEKHISEILRISITRTFIKDREICGESSHNACPSRKAFLHVTSGEAFPNAMTWACDPSAH